MGDTYERLCWVYTTMSNTLVYDHKGDSHHLSDISDLLIGKIPYPEQFSEKPDYEQDSLLQDLRMKTSFVQGLIGSSKGGILPIWRFVSMQMQTRNIFPWKPESSNVLKSLFKTKCTKFFVLNINF